MDENTFFRQATLAICSSLDCEVALYRCFQFLSKHIPIDSIYMNIHDEEALQIKHLAMAGHSGGEKLDQMFDIPREALEIIRNEIPQKKLCSPRDILSTVNYLIDTSYITGESLNINGGLIDTSFTVSGNSFISNLYDSPDSTLNHAITGTASFHIGP